MSTNLSSSLTVINPDDEINKAIQNEDWFSGFAVAVSYFEYFGARVLKARAMNIPSYEDIFKNMSVNTMTFILRVMNIVDEDTYNKMRTTIIERNKLVHPERGGVAYRHQKQKGRATQLLNDAKECIHKLEQVNI